MLMRPAVALGAEGTVGSEPMRGWLRKFRTVRDWALEAGDLDLAEQLQQALDALARRQANIDRHPIVRN